ncbi:MAG: hypothetical protein SF069_17880 [Phycisphaerae bacterium]|nr:hypothetical protein [Phycisphaerae bacterium]
MNRSVVRIGFGVALAVAAGGALLAPLAGCPMAPPNGNGNQNGSSNTNANSGGPVVDAALIGTWFSATTREGLEFSASGEVGYLDVGPLGELRRMPGPGYRGMTQEITSATAGILTTEAERRLRILLDERRTVDLAGSFQTRDEYVVSDGGESLTILTELYGADDGNARDVFYRRAALGEIVSTAHDVSIDLAGAGTTADAQSVSVDADGRLNIYAEAFSVNTIQIVVTNAVGTYPATAGGADRVRLLQQVNTRLLASFETIAGEIVVTEVTPTETAGTINATARNTADRTDVRSLSGSFRVRR